MVDNFANRLGFAIAALDALDEFRVNMAYSDLEFDTYYIDRALDIAAERLGTAVDKSVSDLDLAALAAGAALQLKRVREDLVDINEYGLSDDLKAVINLVEEI